VVDTEVEASLQSRPRRRSARLLATVTPAVLVVAVVSTGVLWARGVFWAPVSVSQIVEASYTVAGQPPALPWPAEGQAYVEIEGVGSLGSSGPADTPVPIASVTKTMTAYQVLHDHPLGAGQDGPVITITPDLFAASKSAVQDESGIELRQGEQLTERQALEGMLLPSAGDVARLLAAWDAGSVPAFVDRMNARAQALGLNHTHYADPAGIDPHSESTAADQVRLGEHVLQVPALADIVSMKSARLPVVGEITNTDDLIGVNGDVGIKTGSTSQAGGCLLFASRTLVGGQPVTLIGAVLGQPGTAWSILPHAESAARSLMAAAQRSLVSATVVHSGSTVAVLRQRGHADIALRSASDVDVIGWPSLGYKVVVTHDKMLRVASSLEPDRVVATSALAAR
jgi:D-alanyl-D-alanine carboxypeptidase (penicillin-binding protein 5/6)